MIFILILFLTTGIRAGDLDGIEVPAEFAQFLGFLSDSDRHFVSNETKVNPLIQNYIADRAKAGNPVLDAELPIVYAFSKSVENLMRVDSTLSYDKGVDCVLQFSRIFAVENRGKYKIGPDSAHRIIGDLARDINAKISSERKTLAEISDIAFLSLKQKYPSADESILKELSQATAVFYSGKTRAEKTAFRLISISKEQLQLSQEAIVQWNNAVKGLSKSKAGATVQALESVLGASGLDMFAKTVFTAAKNENTNQSGKPVSTGQSVEDVLVFGPNIQAIREQNAIRMVLMYPPGVADVVPAVGNDRLFKEAQTRNGPNVVSNEYVAFIPSDGVYVEKVVIGSDKDGLLLITQLQSKTSNSYVRGCGGVNRFVPH